MDLEKHIWKLLQLHDQVVLPGFGILYTRYSPATIHPTQHLFQPPSKILSFKKNNELTDEILISRISEAEKISPQIAAKAIHDFVGQLENKLKTTGSCFIEGIGKFYFDVEKQLQFLADNTHNFLLTSYGLSDFISQPVLRPENIPGYATKQPQKEKKKRKFIWFRF